MDTAGSKIPRSHALKNVYDFKSGTGDRRRLDLAFGHGFRRSGDLLSEMVEFARPFTGPLSQPDFETFGARMAALQLERIELSRTRKAPDGGPAIDQEPFNEFLMWLALGYGEVPFELVLTNQVIASVEYGWLAVHAAVRGGYSNGITTYNRRSRFGMMSVGAPMLSPATMRSWSSCAKVRASPRKRQRALPGSVAPTNWATNSCICRTRSDNRLA